MSDVTILSSGGEAERVAPLPQNEDLPASTGITVISTNNEEAIAVEPTPQIITIQPNTAYTITGMGGELYISPDDLKDAEIPAGSTATLSTDSLVVKTPDGKTTTYKEPTQSDVNAIESRINNLSKEGSNLQLAVAKVDVTNQKQVDAINERIKEYNLDVNKLNKDANVANLLIKSRNQQINTAPVVRIEYKKPKGLKESIWWGLTPWQEEKGQTISTYRKQVGTAGLVGGIAKSAVEVVAPVAGIAVLTAVAPPLGIAASAALGGYISYQTAKSWDGLSNAEKGFQIGMATLCFVPAIGVAGRAMRNASIGEFKVAGDNLIRAEAKATNDMVKTLDRSYGKTVANSYKAMNKAQGELLDHYIKIETLFQEKGILAKIKAKTGKVDTELVKLRNETSNYEANLLVKAKDFYTKSTSGKMQGGLDSPAIQTLFDDFSKVIVRNTKNFADSITGKNSIESLEKIANNATKRLKEAQEKYPTDPAKWADLAYDASVAETKLELAKLGNPAQMQSKISAIDKILKEGDLTPEMRQSLITQRQRLADSYIRTIKSADVIYPEPWSSRGSVAIATRVKPTISTGSGTATLTKTKQSIKPALVSAFSGLSVGLTPSQRASEMDELSTILATIALVVPSNMNKDSIQDDISDRLQDAIENSTNPAIQELTASQIKISTNIAQKLVEQKPVEKKEIVYPIKINADKKVYLTKKELEASYGWKQGIVYNLWYPPFTKANLIYTAKKPPFIKMIEGKGSAYKSLAIGREGVTKVTDVVDRGLFSVQVVKKKKKPVLKYKRIHKKSHSKGISIAR